MAHLTIQQDGKTEIFELAEPATVIGRHHSCTIQLLDTKASRQHCRIEECDAGSGYKIVDLKSANGTIVNGDRIDHHILEAGDLIEIGAAVIKYMTEGKDVLKRRRRGRGRGRHGRRVPGSRRMRGSNLRPPGRDRDGDSSNGDGGDSSDDHHAADDDTRRPGDGVIGEETQKLPTPAGWNREDEDEDEADRTSSGATMSADIDPMDRAELALAIRRMMNALIEAHEEEGLIEVERIFEEFMSEGAVEPRIQALIEDRELMAAVLDINKAINSELQLDTLLDNILDETIDFTNAERGFLIRAGVEADDPRVERARNFDREPIANADEKFSRGIVNEVMANGRPLLSTNAHEEERFTESESVLQQRLLSVLCVPLRVKDRLIGVLYIDNRFETGVFSERDLLWLESIADQAAIAIENARQATQLAETLDDLQDAHEQLNELNELLEHKLEAREVELANVKARLSPGSGEKRRDRGGYKPKYNYDEIMGHSAPMRSVFEVMDKATDNDMPVLIFGANGTGKELVARALHRNGPRKTKPLVVENCAGVPNTLIETTFFGSVKGAFTGATDKKGHFESAHGGTLFLDEVGELPLDIQAKFLRVLNDGVVRRVGDSKTREVNVRIIAATNRNLEKMVKEKVFREDLYYRLNVLKVDLPELRDRRDDIPELAEAFFHQLFEKNAMQPRPVAPEVYDTLMRYDWPGNVRQLQNIVSRIVTLHRDRKVFTVDCIPTDVKPSETDSSEGPAGLPEIPHDMQLKDVMKMVTEHVEAGVIWRVWKKNRFKKVDTAQELGISRPTLDAKIEAYGLKKRREEDDEGKD